MTLKEVMEDYSLREREAINELKERVKEELTEDVMNDDNMFIRFLRARDFQMNVAEDMLRKHLNWRKANQINLILTDFIPNEVFVQYVPLTMVGFDKEGSPIRYFDFGNLDVKGLLKAITKNELVKNMVAYFEEDVRTMKKQSLKLGKSVQQWTYIFNFENYTLAKATHKAGLEALLSIFQVYESNYPERLKAAFILNSSIYFNMMFAVIKPLLSGNTVRKISIYGKDEWQDDLLKTVDADVLPAFLGGKRTDPDGDRMCRTICLRGRPVPEKLYFDRNESRVCKKPGAKKLEVSRKSKAFISLKVKEPGSLIEWEFETESRNIEFSLNFQEDYSNSNLKIIHTEEIIPKQRINAHQISEIGMYKCDRPGIYTLVFDNTFSWFHSKEIYCKASVISPK